jgi:hypothetical protein
MWHQVISVLARHRDQELLLGEVPTRRVGSGDPVCPAGFLWFSCPVEEGVTMELFMRPSVSGIRASLSEHHSH